MNHFTLSPTLFELEQAQQEHFAIGKIVGDRIKKTLGGIGKDLKKNVQTGGKYGQEEAKKWVLQAIDKLKSNPQSFAMRLMKNTGVAELILDIPEQTLRQGLRGNPKLQKLIIKELFMWTALPYGSMQAAWALGLPTIAAFVFKSAAWMATVQVFEQIKKRQEAKEEKMSMDDAMRSIYFTVNYLQEGKCRTF